MKATTRSSQIAVRIDPDLLTRIDKLTKGVSGLKVPRSEVIRLALEKGLDDLEKENRSKKK